MEWKHQQNGIPNDRAGNNKNHQKQNIQHHGANYTGKRPQNWVINRKEQN